MGCQEDAECFSRSQVAWGVRAERRFLNSWEESVQEGTGAQEDTRGARDIKQPGGRRVTGRMQNSE